MKILDRKALLSTSYLPNIQYITKLLLHKEVLIDIHESYSKQSYRNRCEIYGANGQLPLSIPVVKVNGNRTITKDILIDNKDNWAHVHWGAIVSAYGNSPFFEIFEEELAPLFQKSFKYLIDFNEAALTQVFKSLGSSININYSSEFIKDSDEEFDFRESIHPKQRLRKKDANFLPFPYFQVFGSKHGFKPNLSFIDLMFNEGPQAFDILRKHIVFEN